MHQPCINHYRRFAAANTYRGLVWAKTVVWKCDGSDNGTADMTIWPPHYRKKANADNQTPMIRKSITVVVLTSLNVIAKLKMKQH